MAAASTQVVRTPHQAERLTRQGEAARPLGRLTEELALRGEERVRPASSAEVWVATREALEHAGALGGAEASAERRAATVGAFDAAVAWLRRTGARGRVLAGAGPRHALVGRIADEAQATLAAASLVDGRALAAQLREAAQARKAPAFPKAPATSSLRVVGVVPGELDALVAIEALHAASRAEDGGALRLALPQPRSAEGAAGEALAAYLERRWGALRDPPEIAWLAPLREDLDAERIEAPTPEAEARELAAAVRAAIAAGCPPEAIAVVVPRADDPLVPPLLDALTDGGIPCSREGGPAALTEPEAAIALELLSMATGRLRRDGLADLLWSPGLHAGAWVAAADEREAARAAARVAHRLREVPVAVDRSGGARIVEALALRDERAAGAVERLVGSLRPLARARGRGAVMAAWSDLVGRLRLGQPSASELGAALRAEQDRGLEGGAAAAQLAAMAGGARGVAAVLGIGQALASADTLRRGEGDGFDAGELLAEVRELARGARSGAAGGAPRAAAVRIATPRDLAGLTHRWVMVAGLGASAYGASEVRGLLGEEALAELPEVHRPPPVAVRRTARALELAWVLSGAERLVFTRRAGLAGGHDEAPHPLFGEGPPRRRAPASRVIPGARPASLHDAALASLAEGGAPAAEPARGLVAAARRSDLERTRFFLDPRTASGPFSGRLTTTAAEVVARFRGDAAGRSIPVTTIERAARCAFASFGGRVLGVRRIEDALEEASARERGTLVHGALQAAFEALRELPPSATPELQRARAEEAARASAWGAGEPTPLRREAILGAVRDAMAVVQVELASGEAASFRLAEQRFGGREGPSSWPPLELPPTAGEPSVWVEGQIDRLDGPVDGRWLRVVDYKTGKLPRKKDEHVRSLQLALYAEAARQAGLAARGPAAVELSARYVIAQRGGVVKTRDVTIDEEALDEARRSARRVVLRLWSGEVGARAVDPRACRRCDVRDICRKPAIAVDEDASEGASEDAERAAP